jgi:chromosome segregation ATPase
VAKYSAEVKATEELHEHYMTMINAYYMLFSEDLNSPESLDELNAAIEEIIAEYGEDIIELSEDLNDAKKALLELQNGTDSDSVAYEQTLDRLTDKVEEIEAQINARLGEIEYYEDLLKKTLEVFAGADDDNA